MKCQSKKIFCPGEQGCDICLVTRGSRPLVFLVQYTSQPFISLELATTVIIIIVIDIVIIKYGTLPLHSKKYILVLWLQVVLVLHTGTQALWIPELNLTICLTLLFIVFLLRCTQFRVSLNALAFQGFDKPLQGCLLPLFRNESCMPKYRNNFYLNSQLVLQVKLFCCEPGPNLQQSKKEESHIICGMY